MFPAFWTLQVLSHIARRSREIFAEVRGLLRRMVVAVPYEVGSLA